MTVTWWPRRASAIAVYSPVGPAPTITECMKIPRFPAPDEGNAHAAGPQDVPGRLEPGHGSTRGTRCHRRTPDRHHPGQRPGIPRSTRTEETACHLIHRRSAGSGAAPQPMTPEPEERSRRCAVGTTAISSSATERHRRRSRTRKRHAGRTYRAPPVVFCLRGAAGLTTPFGSDEVVCKTWLRAAHRVIVGAPGFSHAGLAAARTSGEFWRFPAPMRRARTGAPGAAGRFR